MENLTGIAGADGGLAHGFSQQSSMRSTRFLRALPHWPRWRLSSSMCASRWAGAARRHSACALSGYGLNGSTTAKSPGVTGLPISFCSWRPLPCSHHLSCWPPLSCPTGRCSTTGCSTSSYRGQPKTCFRPQSADRTRAASSKQNSFAGGVPCPSHLPAFCRRETNPCLRRACPCLFSSTMSRRRPSPAGTVSSSGT